MSLATGRWTGIDVSKPRVGADPVVVVVNAPEKRNGWKTFVILAAVATGIYILSPTAVNYYKYGRLRGPSCDDDRHEQ